MDEKNVQTFNSGDVIFSEGEKGDRMYILLEGVVELKKKVEKGFAVLKTVSAANEFFGEMALVDDRPRSATAVAAKSTRVIVVEEATFENLVLTNGKFALKIIKVLAERIRQSNVQIGDLIETDPKERILRGMVDFAVRNGERIFDRGIKVDIEQMKEWINSHLGIPVADIDAYLFRLLKENTLRYSATGAKTRESIVLSQAFLAANNRRESTSACG